MGRWQRGLADSGVVAQFVIARNPEPDSRLPYLLWVPLGQRGLVFKAGGTWPRTNAVYCHPVEDFPADVEVLERAPITWRRSAAGQPRHAERLDTKPGRCLHGL
jgi:hypothetical protein